jgi:hypothetical protein
VSTQSGKTLSMDVHLELTVANPRIVAASKGRTLLDGLALLGTRALHMKVHVQSIDQVPIKDRLDSGADIMLMSEEYWESIPELPKPKEGLQIKLYHLMGDARVLGYVKTTLFMEAKDGTVISFDLEAYIVKNMKVPLLLGKDFQMMYELGVSRQATGHSEISIGKTGYSIAASSAQGVDLGFEIRQAYMTQSFVRRKTLQCHKAKYKSQDFTPLSVTAAANALIAAESVHNVPLCTSMDGREDWIVEKIIIGTNDSNIMATLTTWVSSQYPYLPIVNPSKLPHYIHAGEIIGHLVNPEEFVDRPTTNKSWVQHATSAEAMKSVIQGSLCA